MPSYVVTQGTCTKGQIFQTLVNAMISAGWQNVSSNPSTDYAVLQSTGTSGNMNLVIQLRSLNAGGTVDSATTDNATTMSYRLVGGYTPGSGGASGTFARNTTQAPWRELCICSNNTTTPGKNTIVNYKYFANKNFIVFTIEYPSGTNTYPSVFWIGIPDITYCTESGSRGLLVAQVNQAVVNGSVDITDTPADIAANTGTGLLTYGMPIYTTLSPKNPNSAGQYMISDMFYGDTTVGVRGKLTGIWALPNQNILTGDTITIGSNTYYALVCTSYGNNSFGNQVYAFAVQVA
jgi:hypothetical protein